MNKLPRAAGLSKYRANAGCSEQNSIQYYRINIYFPMLDYIIQDLKTRFGPHHEKIAGLSGIVPSFLGKTVWTDILQAVNKYSMFLDPISVVQGEFELWKHKWLLQDSCLEINTAIMALSNCVRAIFPNIYTILQILAVLPVTTAQPERVFSKLENTVTAIRSTMSEERLEALILLQVHRDRTPSCESVLTAFAERGARKLNFLL
jgi:hypothetical protein